MTEVVSLRAPPADFIVKAHVTRFAIESAGQVYRAHCHGKFSCPGNVFPEIVKVAIDDQYPRFTASHVCSSNGEYCPFGMSTQTATNFTLQRSGWQRRPRIFNCTARGCEESPGVDPRIASA